MINNCVFRYTGVGILYVVYPAALADVPLAPLWTIIIMLMVIDVGFASMVRMNLRVPCI